MDEDEANEAAYCLLAMSRGKNNSSSSHQQRLDCKGGGDSASSALSAALGHQTLMEQQQPTTNRTTTTTFSAALSAAAQTSPNRNSSDAPDRQQQKSPFMIARILTDLTRVRQNLFSVEPLKQPTSDQRNQSKHHHIPWSGLLSFCSRALMIFKLSPPPLDLLT